MTHTFDLTEEIKIMSEIRYWEKSKKRTEYKLKELKKKLQKRRKDGY